MLESPAECGGDLATMQSNTKLQISRKRLPIVLLTSKTLYCHQYSADLKTHTKNKKT